ncbi:MAG: hypothetical protein QM479_12325 [Pseudomonadota bacterium]
MFKIISLLIITTLFSSAYWFYNKINTPQNDSNIRVTNLPWQITIVNSKTTHVFGLDIGTATLEQAVKILKSEYHLAWFENKDQSISLEAYFIRVNLSGLRAKIVLELDTTDIDIKYLKQNSGKPEILASHAIKYPLDDLTYAMSKRTIKSLTYIPKSSVDSDLLQQRFGSAAKVSVLNNNTEFWLYPKKGLVMTINKKGKEAFQYVPLADFERLESSIEKTVDLSNNSTSSSSNK